MTNEEREIKKRRILAAQRENADASSSDGENDAREQQSLEINSRSYKEFVHDNYMNSHDDYETLTTAQAAKTNKRYVKDREKKAKERMYSAKERTYNAQAREKMRLRNVQNETANNNGVYKRKAYNHIKKEDMQDDAYQESLDMAYETESLDDDKLIERKMPKTLETIKYDDGVTEDDYMKAVSKSASRYLD